MSETVISSTPVRQCCPGGSCLENQRVVANVNCIQRTARGLSTSPQCNERWLTGRKQQPESHRLHFRSQLKPQSGLTPSNSGLGHRSLGFKTLEPAAQSRNPQLTSSFSPRIGETIRGGQITRNTKQRRRGGAVCLFGGLFGGNKGKETDTVATRRSFYHGGEPPFPNRLLDGTHLSGRDLRCCYRASIDGFGADVFHECCDFKGPCIILAETDSGLFIGAFNSEGWGSTDDYRDSYEAFLFYWPEGTSSTSRAFHMPVKLSKVGGSGAAIFDYARGGPQFGSDGLLIGPPLTPVMGGFSGPDSVGGLGDLSSARSRLGNSYARRGDGKPSLFGDSTSATLVEVEGWCSPEIARLY